ncbi:hypothetical protein SPHINGOAX6_70624 [Sphingomonas sp. AX6]|nr:hypothetical protein SPHINGOAX6_70624 [Sphingomonas sp. AX6]
MRGHDPAKKIKARVDGREAKLIAGPVPERPASFENPGDHVPGQGREVTGHRHLVR